MADTLRDHLHAALPAEESVRAALNTLPQSVWDEAVRELEPLLPTFDVVLTTGEDSGALAAAVVRARGETPTVAVAGREPLTPAHLRSGPWWLAQSSLAGGHTALIVTSWLTDGLTELQLGSLARSAGVSVAGVLSAVEFTALGARGRLDMIGVRVDSLARLAHTPAGLAVERRGPPTH